MSQSPRRRNLSRARSFTVCIAGCGLLFLGLLAACGRGEFASLETLPVSSYLERPGDFLGNTYLLQGRIDSQIMWEQEVGRILALEPEGSARRLPVFVPTGAGQNLYVGQVYETRVTIREGGLIYVEALRKF